MCFCMCIHTERKYRRVTVVAWSKVCEYPIWWMVTSCVIYVICTKIVLTYAKTKHGHFVFSTWLCHSHQCYNPRRSPASPSPPPHTANHASAEWEGSLSCLRATVASCAKRQGRTHWASSVIGVMATEPSPVWSPVNGLASSGGWDWATGTIIRIHFLRTKNTKCLCLPETLLKAQF